MQCPFIPLHTLNQNIYCHRSKKIPKYFSTLIITTLSHLSEDSFSHILLQRMQPEALFPLKHKFHFHMPLQPIT